MRKLYRSLLWTGLVAAGVAACGDNVTIPTPPPPPPPPTPTVHSVSVTPNGVSVGVGATVTMVASVNADAGVATTVTWSVLDATRASITGAGVFSAIAAGPVGVRACSTVNAAVCGDATITITSTAATVTSVTVTPGNANMVKTTPAQTLQLAVSVAGTNNPSQVVTWNPSPAPTIATVSATGLVTALGGGTTTITACSTVAGFTNVCGSAGIVVQVPTAATVSIQSVTWVPTMTLASESGPIPTCIPLTGQPSVAVTLTNVRCQIEVTANVNAGDLQLSRLDVLIAGRVVASQTFPGTAPANEGNASVSQSVLVTESVNTTQVSAGTLAGIGCGTFLCVPVIPNGNESIALNLYVTGVATPIASNAVPVVMNNVDAMTSPTTLAPASTTISAPGNGTSGGVTWYTGSSNISGGSFIAFSTVAPTAVNYTAGGSAGCANSSSTVGGSASSGLALSGVFTCGTAPAGNEGSLTTNTDGFIVSYAPSVIGPDGTALQPPNTYSSVGTAFCVPKLNNPIFVGPAAPACDSNSDKRWNLLAQDNNPVPSALNLTPIWIDNLAPSTTVTTPAFNTLFDQYWINSNTYNLLSNVFSVDGGSSAPPIPTILPVRSASLFVGITCSAAVLPNPSLLAETVTSNSITGYRLCGRGTDAIGNTSTSGGSATGPTGGFFGVDNGLPTSRFGNAAAGSGVVPVFANIFLGSALANQTSNIYLAVPAGGAPAGPAVFGVEGQDTRSGFNQNGLVAGIPATQSIVRLAPSGVPCAGISGALATVLSDNWVRSVGTEVDCAAALGVGYYNYSATVTDRAGNTTAPILRNLAIDPAAPVASSVGLSTVFYTAATPAPFFLFGSDDLEVIESDITLNYGGMDAGLTGIQYPLNPITGAARWDGALTNILAGSTTSQVAYLLGRIDFTCTGAGTPYAGCAAIDNKDAVGAEYDNFDAAPADAIFNNADKNPTLVGAILHDVFGTPSAPVSTGILTAQTCAPAGCPTIGTAQQWSGADIVTWKIVAPTTTTVVVEHKASTSIVVPFFDFVLLTRVVGANIVVCPVGSAAPVLTDNGVNRFWTYTFTKPSSGPCSAGGVWRAVGVKTGAALVTVGVA